MSATGRNQARKVGKLRSIQALRASAVMLVILAHISSPYGFEAHYIKGARLTRWMHFPTLVSSGSGVSRAPAVVAAALSLVHQETPERCLQQVTRHHPSDVSPALWSDVTGILSSLP